LADEPITLEELAEQFGISRERVRQIEARAFEKVRCRVIGALGAADAAASQTIALAQPETMWH
jgi:RNA polymerase sigma-32 factor